MSAPHHPLETTYHAATYFERLIKGDRVALGQIITLAESQKDADREKAVEILTICEQHLHLHDASLRLAISGAPGAGKSTLIDALGTKALQDGHRVGVITIDPSSTLSHGSILGDKSRMNRLSRDDRAFVRTSPAGEVLGGVGRRTMEIMTIMATAGFDIILLETVGVGQSELTAWQFTDGFILVAQPGAGDELQGIKRGITELADIVIVSKADHEMEIFARQAKAQLSASLHYFSSTRAGWTPEVVACSALTDAGMEDAWSLITKFASHLGTHTLRADRRKLQKQAWLEWSSRLHAQEIVFRHSTVTETLASATRDIVRDASAVYVHELKIAKQMNSLFSKTSHSD